MHGSASPRTADRRRAVALVCLTIAAAASVAVVLLGGGRGHTYRVELINAGQLVTGDDLVRIGGVPAGSIEHIGLSRDDQALVTIRLDPGRPALHDGTTAVVRAKGLAGVASRYIDVSPGPGSRTRLAQNAILPASRTQSIVDLDQLFDTLDVPTRRGLRRLIDGSASWYDGASAQANRSARYAPAALSQLQRLAAEVNQDTPAFAQFLVEVGGATETLAARRTQLTELITDARTTTNALAADSAALGSGLRALPPAVRQGTRTLNRLRAAVPDLRRLVRETREPARLLPGLLADARPAVARAVPATADLRRLVDGPGATDDLVDALEAVPLLRQQTRTGVPAVRRALRQGLPDLQFVRPYAPDVVAWVQSFGAVMGTYDAMGHYARTQPVFDAYDVADDGQGGRLVARSPALRGSSAALSTGNTRRCPGAAAPTSDGSGNWVDSGPDANADCDRSQAVGGDG